MACRTRQPPSALPASTLAHGHDAWQVDRALKSATPPALAFPHAVMHAVSLGLQAVTQLKRVRHDALCEHAAASEQHVLSRQVFWQASVELNPPHCELPSELSTPHAEAQWALRQFPSAANASLPFGFAVAHAFWQVTSPAVQPAMQLSSAVQSAFEEQSAPCEQQLDEKQVSQALELNVNPPHVPPASPVVAPAPHEELHSLLTQPVSALKSVTPPGFAVRHP